MKFFVAIFFCNLIIASYGTATHQQIQQLLEKINHQDEKIAELEHQQREANQVSNFPVKIYCLIT